MKKYQILAICLFSIIIIQVNFQSSTAMSKDNTALTIYTYDSLLADPGYDFVGNFSKFASIQPDQIKVVYMSDAAELVTKAALEKDSPQADIIIGIDNALVHKARELDILTPYKSPNLDNLRDGLVEGLAEDNLLTPYDYGVISLWYDTLRFDKFNNFSLTDLLNEDIQKQLIIEDPRLSSPGLGFLLWSISELGYNYETSEPSNTWKNFWIDLNNNVLLANSWGDAINLFYTPEVNRSIMVSYTTSPAYGACLYDDYTTNSQITTDTVANKGWFQIEGLGIVKNSPHQELAKEFIDWFISGQLQDEIYLNQWVYPAAKNTILPDCYSKSTLSPDNILAYNSQIPGTVLSDNLDQWLEDWEFYWTFDGKLTSDDLTTNTLNTSNEAILPLYLNYWMIFISFPIIKKRRRLTGL